MDYEKIYENLTKTRQQMRGSKRQVGYELHHIQPSSLGGSNDESNLVLLTHREHYIAHWLLTKIYPDEPKVHYGFLCMLRDPHGERKLTSRMVETIKKNYSEFKKWHSKISNPMFHDSAKKKLSEHMKKNNPMTRFPEKNHTVKRTVVHYEDGTIKEFAMKKDFMDTLTGLTRMQKRYKIDKNDLKEFGIIKIERFGRTEACEG